MLRRESRFIVVPPISERMLIATRPVDFPKDRKGMDGLGALVQEELKADPTRARSTSSTPHPPTA